eukprot:Rmarinus@m.26314
MDDFDGPERQIIYENTYRMSPLEGTRFSATAVKPIIQKALKEELEGKKFHADESRQTCLKLTDQIKAEVKKLGFPRYKIMVQVVIGEIKGQSVRVASRSLWDADKDNYASASFKNSSLYCVAMVFGCYTE